MSFFIASSEASNRDLVSMASSTRPGGAERHRHRLNYYYVQRRKHDNLRQAAVTPQLFEMLKISSPVSLSTLSIHWFFMVSKCSYAALFPGFFSKIRAAEVTWTFTLSQMVYDRFLQFRWYMQS